MNAITDVISDVCYADSPLRGRRTPLPLPCLKSRRVRGTSTKHRNWMNLDSKPGTMVRSHGQPGGPLLGAGNSLVVRW